MNNRWEYTCVSVTESSLNYADLVNHLNKMGKEGWELVGIASPVGHLAGVAGRDIENRLTYWMKRPLD